MINCIIVDDEPLARKLLENHISKIKDLKLIGIAKDAVEAYRILHHQKVDLIFLDIQMPDLTGLEFLRALHTKPRTIFTTAFREYAIEGFELEAVDYLLKPVTFERFFRAVEKILRNLKNESEEEYIIVKADGYQRKVRLPEIVYIESDGNDVKIILDEQSYSLPRITITELASRLADKGFIRMHRSFLINSARITATGYHEILLGKFSTPVGRSYKVEFDKFVKNFSSKKIL